MSTRQAGTPRTVQNQKCENQSQLSSLLIRIIGLEWLSQDRNSLIIRFLFSKSDGGAEAAA
jgi:hypothetical protein